MPELYPFKFVPIFKNMLWGGHRLAQWLGEPTLLQTRIGEAWLISDVDDHLSLIRNGPWTGISLRELLQRRGDQVLGPHQQYWIAQGRFPLLLKFIDAQRELSVQVHPNDQQAALLGSGRFGKTEAWVILDRHPHHSRIFAGLRPGVTTEQFRQALRDRQVVQLLHQYIPAPGDCLFLEAGTVHALGANLLVFEIQQSSDITYRLYDWDRIDELTGQPRPLQVAQALACINWSRGPCYPVRPAVTVNQNMRREGLVCCPYFTLERVTLAGPAPLGCPKQCRILVSIEGVAQYNWDGQTELLRPGEVVLIPASLGTIWLQPLSSPVVVLECGLPPL
jgi:mannose-6-phosphate isomerase